MDPESKKLLEDTFRIAQENNDMLHSMRRSLRLARFMTFLYWAFIIGSALGAYYLLQPYIDGLKDVYTGASGVLDNFKEFGQ